jgi:hypothetical protein
VVAAIVDRQAHAQRILVGDRCQAIYGWRGAIDAMSRFQADHRLCLSQSFRFGPAIATEANQWLQLLDAPLHLRGFDKITSTVGPVARPDAVLCRTNAEAVRQLLVAADAGRKAALVGGGSEIRRLAEAAISLRAGADTDHPELFALRTWGEVQDYVEQDASGSDLKVFVQLIDTYGPEVVIDLTWRPSILVLGALASVLLDECGHAALEADFMAAVRAGYPSSGQPQCRVAARYNNGIDTWPDNVRLSTWPRAVWSRGWPT